MTPIPGRLDPSHFVREDDPYDVGYWACYDGKPRPADATQAKGWDDCRDELRFEQNADVVTIRKTRVRVLNRAREVLEEHHYPSQQKAYEGAKEHARFFRCEVEDHT